jgi:signal transduction histidine kinase
MSLQTRTRLFAALGATLSVPLLLAFLYAQHLVTGAAGDLARVSSFKSAFAEFRTVAMEYFTSGGQRPLVQAESKLQQLNGMLEVLASDPGTAESNEAVAAWQEVRKELAATATLLGQLPGSDAPLENERDRRTVRLFLMRSQAVRSAVDKLQGPLTVWLERGQEIVEAGVVVLIGSLLVQLAVAVMLLERGILRPLKRLGDGLGEVGRGNLQIRLKSGRSDEIGQLARVFDGMLDRLQEITVSRDRLEAETAERKRAEAAIQRLNADLEARVRVRTAELEAANHELEAFAYSVSHDLRAPLRAVDGFGRKLETGFAAQLGDEGRRQLDVIRSNARRMGQLIDDLLAFSRIGRAEMRRAPVDMQALAQSVVAETQAAETGRAIEIAVADLPDAAGDHAMLRQVWTNLVSNAVKFTQPREIARIAIDGRREGAELLYRVRDNGVGFDMQYADKLFGVFQRLHGIDEFEGTGVGLALSRRIVQRHGGRIWADARLGEGATFYFTLPQDAAGETARSAA